MSESRLELLGPYDAWHGAAQRGRFAMSDGTVRPVLVLLGPEGANADAHARGRAAASYALVLRAPGVLPLISVDLWHDRVAWVHEHVDGVGLGLTVGREGEGLLSSRAAAELVASVADTIRSSGQEGRKNRGPEPSDILVDGAGRAWVAGFSGPFGAAPSMRPPRGDEGEPACVYRLGVLLAHLLSGVPPQPASEKNAHAALVRRALIRAMARPGPVLSERYGDWMRGMLAWEPAERPPLSKVPDGLRHVAESTGGEPLREWCARWVPVLRARAEGRNEQVPTAVPIEREEDGAVATGTLERDAAPPVRSSPLLETDPPPRRSRSSDPPQGDRVGRDVAAEGVASSPGDLSDDPTQEASSLAAMRQSSLVPRGTSLPPQAMIPVRVGPPPEAIREPPTLPMGFLDASSEDPEVEPEEQVVENRAARGPSWTRVFVVGVYVTFVCLLAGVAALFLAYLLLPGPAQNGQIPPPPEDEPSLHDVLNGAPPVPPPELPVLPPDGTEIVPPAEEPPPEGVPLEPQPLETQPPAPETFEFTHLPPAPTPPVQVVGLPPAPAPVAAPDHFAVTFLAADPAATIKVECNEVTAEGVGQVDLRDVGRGPCIVTTGRGDAMLRASVGLTGPARFRCFGDGLPMCE